MWLDGYSCHFYCTPEGTKEKQNTQKKYWGVHTAFMMEQTWVLGYGFSPLWKNDQLRRWVPGTRTSLELYLKEEVRAWELEAVRYSCSLVIFSPETDCRYSPYVKFWKPMLHSCKLNELERKQTRLFKVLHGITSPLQYINIYIFFAN